MSASCSTCGAEIVWAITQAGKRTPLDAKPVRVAIAARDTEGAEIRDGDALVIGGSANGHQSHFATCPNAASHRRTR